jgi:hypothetical protein
MRFEAKWFLILAILFLSVYCGGCAPATDSKYHVHEIRVPPEASIEQSRESLHRVWTQIFHVIDLTEIKSISTDGKSWIRVEWPNDNEHHHNGDNPGFPDGFWWPGKDFVCRETWRNWVKSAILDKE